jgi:hypothetical protein
MQIEIEKVPGATELVNWFGYWPDFHDAEILSLELNRTGSSVLRIHTWEMTKDIDDQGFYILRKHVIVDLLFDHVIGLDLSDFNEQNVISGLSVKRNDDGFRVELGACYGLAGSIEAKEIAFRITPAEAPTS